MQILLIKFIIIRKFYYGLYYVLSKVSSGFWVLIQKKFCYNLYVGFVNEVYPKNPTIFPPFFIASFSILIFFLIIFYILIFVTHRINLIKCLKTQNADMVFTTAALSSFLESKISLQLPSLILKIKIFFILILKIFVILHITIFFHSCI